MIDEKVLKRNIFYERLIKECSKLKKSVNQVERELGLPRNSLHSYKKQRVPSGERLLEIGNYFGVTPEYLLGRDYPINENEQFSTYEMNKVFKSLSFKNKIELCKICSVWMLSYLFE